MRVPPDHTAHPTILDPDGEGRAVYITATGTVTLDRLTLVNGSSANLGGGPGSEDAGGGIYNEGADLTLRATRLYNSEAALGGGLYSNGGALLLQNNLLHGNTATTGGAVHVNNGAATLEYNTLYDNQATGSGGGVYLGAGSLLVTNTIFAGNTAGDGGPAYAEGAATANLDHNLYNNNSPDDTVTGADSNENPIEANPLFVSPGDTPANLHLLSGSPAFDRAIDTGLHIDYDNDSRPLPAVGGFDIGADERVPVQGLLFYSSTVTTTQAGQDVVITHTLKNTGDVTDTFTISYSSNQTWPITFDQTPPYTISLGSGLSQTVGVTYSVPSDANGLTNLTTITATASLTSVFEFVRDEINVSTAAWQITKIVTPAATVQPGGSLTYTLTLTNVGDLPTSGVYTITDELPNHTHYVSADPRRRDHRSGAVGVERSG